MARDRERYGETPRLGAASARAEAQQACQSVPDSAAGPSDQSLVRKPQRPLRGTDRSDDLERLSQALEKLAILLIDNDRYAPIFERLMAERETLLAKQDVRAWAQAFLAERGISGKVVRNG